MLSTSANKSKSRQQASDIAASFILKSFQLLEEQKFTDIVDWNEEGTAIVIKKPVEFGNTVLPTYFKHGNITSFTRQLNMYHFRKRRNHLYDLVYYHDQFQRGEKHLLKNIKRKIQQNNVVAIHKALSVLQDKKSKHESEADDSDSPDNDELKQINKTAMERIASLEKTLEELMAQNKTLQDRAELQSKKEAMLTSFMSSVLRKTGTTKEQLYEVLENQSRRPPLNLEEDNFTLKTEELESVPRQSLIDMIRMGNHLNHSDSDKTTQVPSCSSKNNSGAYLGESNYEDGVSRRWGPQGERSNDDYQITRIPISYSDEFEYRGKILKTDDYFSGEPGSLRLHGSLHEVNNYQDLKVEDEDNIYLNMYSSMNDYLRDGQGYFNLE